MLKASGLRLRGVCGRTIIRFLVIVRAGLTLLRVLHRVSGRF